MVLPTVGYEESVIGEPIGGISEDFFKKLKQLTGIPDDEIYFTNLIKCGSDDDLTSAHVKACKGWLFEELLQLENLKTIFTFGALSTRILLGLKTTFKFADYVYKKWIYPKAGWVDVYPLYAPSYVIQRSQKEFDTLIENVLKGK